MRVEIAVQIKEQIARPHHGAHLAGRQGRWRSCWRTRQSSSSAKLIFLVKKIIFMPGRLLDIVC